jgi:adenine-specific DNA-methyltransferase
MLTVSRGEAMPTLEFKGKPFVYSHHLSVPFRELVVEPKKSLPAKGQKPSLDDNLIIHGDNLEALKALLPRYAGKIDVIYIDPPYNTGNEGWAYNDKVNSPLMKEWLGRVVDQDDLERHDKWLCMIWPRLALLKELLSSRGVLFISINSIEKDRLGLIIREIFGDDLYLGEFIWKSRQNKDSRNKSGISEDHEYVLAVGVQVRGEKRSGKGFSNPDNDPRGDWSSGNMVGLASEEARPNLHYDLINPKTRINYGCPPRGWRYEPSTMKMLISEDKILWPSSKDGRPREKQFLSELPEYTNASSVLDLDIYTRNGTMEFEEIFGHRDLPFPKPSKLISYLIELPGFESACVLDSFAGSGTTGQAVLALNKRDGGNRKFILVETESYADKLTAERVRRVIKGVPKATDELLKKGLGGSFTFCELGEALDLERFFDGKGTPRFDQVARYVVYTATGQSVPDVPSEPRKDWFVAEAGGYRIHLIYKPDLDFMRSNDAALAMPLAKEIAKGAKGKPVLVYAAAKFMAHTELTKLGIKFCQLPYSVHRVLGEAPDV